jgi:hypothetical protein
MAHFGVARAAVNSDRQLSCQLNACGTAVAISILPRCDRLCTIRERGRAGIKRFGLLLAVDEVSVLTEPGVANSSARLPNASTRS